jgi:hypothetical protein
MKLALCFVALLVTGACGSDDAAPDGASESGGGGARTGGSGGRSGETGGAAGAAGSPSTSGGQSAAGRAGVAGAAGAGSNEGDCASNGDGRTTLVFVNHCRERVIFAGSEIQGGALAAGATECVDIGSATETLSAKRYWGFTGDDPGSGRHTLAEFTFNTDFNDFDWYNISHVDAFNLPMQIIPRDHSSCDTLTCAGDFLAGCPEVGRYRDGADAVVACVSPERDQGDSPVAEYFESCDDAYAWSGDDQHGDDPSPVRACAGEDWAIVFCPEARP